MEKRIYRNVYRTRPLTKAEIDKYQTIREQVQKEFPPATPNPMHVAIAKLRAMRAAKGISLAELAARTGMTRGNIARLETKKNATLRTLARYAEGLGCNLELSVVSETARKRKPSPSSAKKLARPARTS